jgi:hypothetical protein
LKRIGVSFLGAHKAPLWRAVSHRTARISLADTSIFILSRNYHNAEAAPFVTVPHDV